MPAQHWFAVDIAEGRDRNVIEFAFAKGVRWKNNVISGNGAKGFVPDEIKFKFPGRPILVECEVLHFPDSASGL